MHEPRILCHPGTTDPQNRRSLFSQKTPPKNPAPDMLTRQTASPPLTRTARYGRNIPSTNSGTRVGGYRREVDNHKLGPALLIASSLVLAIRTARWSPTHSDELSHIEWDSEVEHSVRVAEMVPVTPDRLLAGAFPDKGNGLVCRDR
jgi:hypothetical protein